MSCRSTSCSSAATSFARAVTGLSDQQVQSLFHGLKRYAKDEGIATPSAAEYADGVAALAMKVRASSSIDEATRTRLGDRLDAAAGEPALDGPAWYAVEHIVAQAEIAAGRIDAYADKAASDMHLSAEDAREAVTMWRDAPAGSFEDYHVPDAAYRYDLDPIVPQDAATARALRKLGYEHYLAQPHPVFVYGTLRSGQGNHVLMRGATEQIAPAVLPGAAVYGAHRGFPYAKEHDAPDAVTAGEVIWLAGETRGRRARWDLDGLEGFSSDWPTDSHYERVLRDVRFTDRSGAQRTVAAWTYMARGNVAAQLMESDRIIDGDWVAAKDAYRASNRRERDFFASDWLV